MKAFIIHQCIRRKDKLERTEYSYKKTLNKAFETRQEARKYLEGTIGAVYKIGISNKEFWGKETAYNFYMYEIQQVTID